MATRDPARLCMHMPSRTLLGGTSKDVGLLLAWVEGDYSDHHCLPFRDWLEALSARNGWGSCHPPTVGMAPLSLHVSISSLKKRQARRSGLVKNGTYMSFMSRSSYSSVAMPMPSWAVLAESLEFAERRAKGGVSVYDLAHVPTWGVVVDRGGTRAVSRLDTRGNRKKITDGTIVP
eukprot:scaffold79969_cov36-Tisochrysis_lutea.AAC.1